MFNRKCKITFVAHGATIYSEENRLSNVENYPPLNELGCEEIHKIADFIKKRGLKNDKIYASPALRTIQSAEIIAKTLKKDFEIIDGLTGRKYGKWSSLTYEEINEKHPNFYEQLHSNPCSITPEGGESMQQFYERICPILSGIVEKHTNDRIIVVTQPSVIRAAVCKALNIPLENFGKLYVKTGSATQISYFENWASLMYSGYVPL